MNCDQVFDILTRGPFPTGDASDADVERHLSACHECRPLAEALRAAIDLFHESVDLAEGLDLPGYHGVLDWTEHTSLSSAVMTAIAKESAPSQRMQPRTSTPTHVGLWRFAAAAMLGAVLCSLLWAMSSSQGFMIRDGSEANSQGNHATQYQPDEQGKHILAALQLPVACQPPTATVANAARPSGGAIEYYLCCTQCHSAASDDQTIIASVAVLTRSCGACHHN